MVGLDGCCVGSRRLQVFLVVDLSWVWIVVGGSDGGLRFFLWWF